MTEQKKEKNFLPVATLVVLVAFLSGMYTQQLMSKGKTVSSSNIAASPTPVPGLDLNKLQEEVIPPQGYKFSVNWGDLGKRMVDDGVIDKTKLAQALTGTDKLPPEFEKYFDGSDQKTLDLNDEYSHFWVDVLWAVGLSNKNEILEKGPMMEQGNAANFASTGGYTLGVMDAMTYYSKFSYIQLNEKQQALVKEIAENVYRPCCGNSTYFPDCNHGMAALGLIELMASQNKSKDEIYKTVLAFNSYWFPQTYYDIAYHFAKNGRNFKDVSAKEILSKTFSSAMGYQAIRKQIGNINWPALKQSGGSCGA
ncbi:MAG: hypothetical protein M1426_02810 [Patescibacteria group bacterium]|nr:hypothetical protein [Patescibacteria group bacterium]